MWIDARGSEVLDAPECQRLLAIGAKEGLHGHLGIALDGAPLVLPVNYLVHGPDATADAIGASDILFGGDLAGMSETTFNVIVGEVPTKELERGQLDGTGKPLVDVLVHSGLAKSKGQGRKDIEGGGVYLNNVREEAFQRAVTTGDLLFGKHLLLRKGKRDYVVITAR